MKFTKRFLATLLTLAMVVSLSLPAMAAVNWDEFRITKQPQDMVIKYGDSFTLSVEVNVPAGAMVEYQWYSGSNKIENATTSELHLEPDDSYYPKFHCLGRINVDYYCEIDAFEKGNNDIVPSQRLRSNRANVTTELTFLGKLFNITLEPFGYALTATLLSPAFTLIFPFAYLYFLVEGFIVGFKGLFS